MDGFRLLTDPILRNRVTFLHRAAPALTSSSYEKIDAVLISHLHYDHLDFPSLRMLPEPLKLVIPGGSAPVLRKGGYEDLNELRIGDSIRLGPLEVEAVFADHVRKRGLVGPSADCLGYIISGSSKIYYPGDTRLFPEMAHLADDLEMALMPVWGWGFDRGRMHMGPREAAEALTLLKPRQAIPIHWGTLVPLGTRFLKPSFLYFPPLEFASWARQLAPEVKVHIVMPGESIDI